LTRDEIGIRPAPYNSECNEEFVRGGTTPVYPVVIRPWRIYFGASPRP
jgi:hypothetical protein